MSLAMILALQVSLSGLPDDLKEGCNDKDGTVALSSCYSDHASLWDKRMRAAYPVAFEHAQGEQRNALKKAQAAWVKYRDETCEFYNLEQGSIHVILSAYCQLDLTRRHALELEEYVLP